MPEPASIWPILTTLIGFTCLVGTIAAWAIVLRQISRREQQWERRLEELTRRLARFEFSRESSRESDPRTGSGPTGRPSDASAIPTGRNIPSAPPERVPAETSNRPTLISIPDLGHEGQPADPQVNDELGQKHSAVWSLAASGAPPEEIARQTGQPIGEVELIVGLHRRLLPQRGASQHVRSQ